MHRARYRPNSSGKPGSAFARRGARAEAAIALRRPESVLVAVYSRDGYVLLIERLRPFRFWQSVTGSLEPGESPEEAARRELREETGLTDEGRLYTRGLSRQFTIDPRWLSNYAPGIRENVEYEWRYELEERREVRLAADEHSAFQWLPLSQAAATVWSWTNRDALQGLPIRSAPSVP